MINKARVFVNALRKITVNQIRVFPSLTHKRVNAAADMIEQLTDKVESLEAKAGTDKNVPTWISTKERLPETGDVVLVIASGKPRPNVELCNAYLIASYWADEGWIADGFEGWDALDVSYWMPLPEEPKEG